MTITDTYRVEGTKLTLAEGSPNIYWIPNTPECWNETYAPSCLHKIDNSTTPSLTLTHDEDKNVVKAVIDNKGQNFQSDRIFIFDMRVKTEGPIAPGRNTPTRPPWMLNKTRQLRSRTSRAAAPAPVTPSGISP